MNRTQSSKSTRSSAKKAPLKAATSGVKKLAKKGLKTAGASNKKSPLATAAKSLKSGVKGPEGMIEDMIDQALEAGSQKLKEFGAEKLKKLAKKVEKEVLKKIG